MLSGTEKAYKVLISSTDLLFSCLRIFARAFISLSLPVSSGQFYGCLLITAKHTSAFHFDTSTEPSLQVRKPNPKTDGDLLKTISVRNKHGTYLVILYLVPFLF